MRSMVVFLLLLMLPGIARAEANLAASRLAVMFPPTRVNSVSKKEIVSIRNTASEDAHVLSFQHGCPASFIFSSDCPSILASGRTCSVAIVFAPKEARTSSCAVVASATNSAPVTFTVSGRGTASQLNDESQPDFAQDN